ncbi:chorismate-binding protein [Salinimicrobium sediminilitoris]|uniref:chorismate-binding protein n=1 Tax=Salinimicrobium sediminilitoris TaxID=2876715 RepID=UPI001E5A981B|nr:chorismate-binding protein [Salinimicrobium sediminilitoris]MCC8358811.1 chorismate-binding protein [Salinimicrobium sediminilitoris]
MPEAEFFNRLEMQYASGLPFVAYRKPILNGSSGEVKAFLQQDDQLNNTEDFTESGFVFAPFDTSEKTILFPENASEKHIFEQVVPEEVSAPVASQKGRISEEKMSAHVQLVAKAVAALKAGEMEKVVLSRKEEVELDNPNPLKLFKELLKAYPTAFVYCWFHPKVGCWLGATPETLLKVTGTRFKTMALAGTQKYSGTMEVEWGDKEKQEQQFVTDSIVDNLKSSGVEDLEISAPYTAKAGNLLHIRSDISGKIPNSKLQISENSGTDVPRNVSAIWLNIISALHPTPAVCGLPKEKAKAFILEEENYNREFYTGFLGELNLQKNVQRSRTRRNVENLAYRAVKKETDLYVNLRCMKIENGKAVLFVGGGITKDSVPEDEWQETVNKSETMKKVLLK